VQELQGVYSVVVVGADSTVQVRQVTTAERVGPLWRIAAGLKAGERIVVEGLQRARPGMRVNATNVEIGEDGSTTQPTQPSGGQSGSQPASKPATLPAGHR
jgi:membrane fusion protein (multidrug efflux system)